MHGPGPHLTLKDFMIERNRELHAENDELIKENLSLYRELAHAKLHAAAGWTRYENKNESLKASEKLILERAGEKIIEIALCEANHIQLKPNQLYRLKVIPSCEQCLNIERELKK